MSSLLFGGSTSSTSSRQGGSGGPAEAATRTACSKLANNAALVVNELAREPAQGLLHVVTHVQRSIPALLHTHQQLEAAAAHLQAVLSELQDAQEGIISVTSPATQQDLAALASSINSAVCSLQQQQQQGPPDTAGVGGAAGAGLGGSGGQDASQSNSSRNNTAGSSSSSSRLRKLFAPSGASGTHAGSSPTAHD